MKITALNNQSLLDISIQETGKAENYLKIAKANNISGTAKLEVGQELLIPDNLEIDSDIVRYYKANNIKPATDVDVVNSEEFKGVGEMEIGKTFRIR